MTTFLPNAGGLAVISGVSTFFWFVIALAVVAGAGVIIKMPQPFKGLGIGLIAGALIITVIIATGPTK